MCDMAGAPSDLASPKEVLGQPAFLAIINKAAFDETGDVLFK